MFRGPLCGSKEVLFETYSDALAKLEGKRKGKIGKASNLPQTSAHRVIRPADAFPTDEDVGHGAATRHVGQDTLEGGPVRTLVEFDDLTICAHGGQGALGPHAEGAREPRAMGGMSR